MNEFADLDEALEALVASVYERGRFDECLQDGSPMPEVEVAAREWIRTLGAYAQDRRGMMTRREVLEKVADKEKLRRQHPNPTAVNEVSDFEYQLALLNAARIHTPMVPIWGIGGKSETRVSRAIHELALLMDAERSGED